MYSRQPHPSPLVVKGIVAFSVVGMLLSGLACAQPSFDPSFSSLPGAILNHDQSIMNMGRQTPYLFQPVNPLGKKDFKPDEPVIIYDESLKKETQVQGQIILPDGDTAIIGEPLKGSPGGSTPAPDEKQAPEPIKKP